MNIYEDYRNYIDECDYIIKMLKENGRNVFYAIEDVIKVTEYIYNEHEFKNSIDEDLEEIFDIGYGFLANVLADMKTYFEDSFDKNPDTFEHYSELLLYSIYIEDFKSYLEVEDLIDDDKLNILNELLNKLDRIFTNRLSIPEGLIEDIDITLTNIGVHNKDYRPTYSVFQLIAEELNLQ